VKYKKLFRKIRSFIPKPILNSYEKYYKWSSLEIEFEKLIVLIFLYSIVFSIITFFLSLNFFGLFVSFIFSLVSLLFVFFLPLLIMNLIADKKASFSEEILPDFLQLMASNIRAGLTPDKALVFSARPEFGILEKEIKNVASKSLAGKPFEEALIELTQNIKSRLIERVIGLIIEGIRKGGEIAKLLEQTADDIRDLKAMKKEISSQVNMYVIFIFLSMGIISPMLFAFATNLIETLSKITKEIKIEGASVPTVSFIRLGFSSLKISPSFIKFYALTINFISVIFGSLVIGLLSQGKEKAGIKFIPILLILNFSIYFIAFYIINSIAGIIAPAAKI